MEKEIKELIKFNKELVNAKLKDIEKNLKDYSCLNTMTKNIINTCYEINKLENQNDTLNLLLQKRGIGDE